MKNEIEVIRQEYYVEVVDKRVDLDPPYVWQSMVFSLKSDAIDLGIKVREEFNQGKIDTLFNKNITDYLNPTWKDFYENELPKNRKGIKSNLKVRIMTLDWISEDEYEIGYVKEIR